MFADMEAEYNKSIPYKHLILQGMLFRLFTTILENNLHKERITYSEYLSNVRIRHAKILQSKFLGFCHVLHIHLGFFHLMVDNICNLYM